MLVLTRLRGERIQIGPDIFLTVVELRGGSVRLGIDAPRELAIHRLGAVEAPRPCRIADPARPTLDEATEAIEAASLATKAAIAAKVRAAAAVDQAAATVKAATKHRGETGGES